MTCALFEFFRRLPTWTWFFGRLQTWSSSFCIFIGPPDNDAGIFGNGERTIRQHGDGERTICWHGNGFGTEGRWLRHRIWWWPGGNVEFLSQKCKKKAINRKKCYKQVRKMVKSRRKVCTMAGWGVSKRNSQWLWKWMHSSIIFGKKVGLLSNASFEKVCWASNRQSELLCFPPSFNFSHFFPIVHSAGVFSMFIDGSKWSFRFGIF